MSNVAIITDSTCGIPDDKIRAFGIRVLPQVLVWDGKTYEDGIDIAPTEFYERLEVSKTLPTTSQVTINRFKEEFATLTEAGAEILCVLLSDKLSGTIGSAVQARELFPNARIEIVNSVSIGMGLGFPVLEAAKASQSGASLEECKTVAEKASQNTGLVLTPATLEFLHRGGRIGGGSRFLGTALNIKPILEIANGKIEAVERVRTRKKVIRRVIEVTAERIGARKPIRLSALHANAQDEAQNLLDLATVELNPEESFLSEVSPVVGCHTGPGTIGLAFLAGL